MWCYVISAAIDLIRISHLILATQMSYVLEGTLVLCDSLLMYHTYIKHEAVNSEEGLMCGAEIIHCPIPCRM